MSTADALFRFAEEFYLTQVIDTPTRGDNTLDIIMIGDHECIHSFNVDKTHLADHNTIILTTNIFNKTQHMLQHSNRSFDRPLNFC